MGLVKSIVSRYSHYGVAFDDLQQEGLMGMMEAAERFDEKRGAKFSTYATYFIKGKVLEYLRKEKKLNIADIDLSENENIEFNPASVYEESTAEARVNGKDKMRGAIPESFPDIEKRVLAMFFLQEKTLKEIAVELDITREKVRQVKQKGVRRLKISHPDPAMDNAEG
jgi:RNA polymerase sigma factor (sigma-70 family)